MRRFFLALTVFVLLILVYSTSGFSASMGQVIIDVQVQRSDGVGSCGSPPWGVDHINGGDFTCVPPKYWYGYDLVATIIKNVDITPTGNGTWEITGWEGGGGGSYQKATHWSDGERVCSPVSITGEAFEVDVEGTYQDGTIELDFATQPVETANWVCDGGHTYVRETTLLLIDWSIATTGDYTSLYVTLDESDHPTTECYKREYSVHTNPSPDNRDYVTATVDFRCMELSGEQRYSTVVCPWEASKENSCPSEEMYGEHSEEAESLRYFRDNVLNNTLEGQEIVELYYELSPVIVNAMRQDYQFREEIKGMVDDILPLIVAGEE